jgi:signal transduction histidine kinase
LQLDGTIKRLSPGGKIALELDDVNQLDGAHWPQLWPGSERERVEEAVAAARDGRRTQFLAFCPTAKATPRWWDVVVTPVPGASASTSELLVVSRDVTELVTMKEALALANDRKDDFLAALSHELRNPLAALAMAATVLETLPGGLPQLSRISELIHRQVGHMSRLTEDLLDVSRIARGQVNLHVEEFDVRELVDHVAEQLGSTLAAKGQVLERRIAPAPLPVRGDRIRLTQVLGNLVGNAARYSAPDAPIRVTVAAQGGQAVLTVRDRGQGIPADQLATLFDMYSQGQATADRKASGVGMGLAIVKGLVELHGGTVGVESAGAGLGSTFSVTLPLAGAV